MEKGQRPKLNMSNRWFHYKKGEWVWQWLCWSINTSQIWINDLWSVSRLFSSFCLSLLLTDQTSLSICSNICFILSVPGGCYKIFKLGHIKIGPAPCTVRSHGSSALYVCQSTQKPKYSTLSSLRCLRLKFKVKNHVSELHMVREHIKILISLTLTHVVAVWLLGEACLSRSWVNTFLNLVT